MIRLTRIIILLVTIYTLSACNVVVYNTQFFVMNTVFDITLYEGTQDDLDTIETHIKYLDKLFDCDDEYEGMNNLATLNNSTDDYIVVEDDLYNIIELSLYYNTYTDGYFNILLKEVNEIWSTAFETGVFPIIDSYSYNLDNSNILLDEENSSILFLNNIKADLGAIAKGYALAYIKDYLTQHNIDNYIINAGSSSILIGSYVQNQPYEVSIKNPNGGFVDTFSLTNTALSTSGNYLQYLDYEGIRYHHIINPFTLVSENYYQSITIINDDTIYCDVMTTALFNIEYANHDKYLLDNTTIAYLTVDDDTIIKEV